MRAFIALSSLFAAVLCTYMRPINKPPIPPTIGPKYPPTNGPKLKNIPDSYQIDFKRLSYNATSKKLVASKNDMSFSEQYDAAAGKFLFVAGKTSNLRGFKAEKSLYIDQKQNLTIKKNFTAGKCESTRKGDIMSPVQLVKKVLNPKFNLIKFLTYKGVAQLPFSKVYYH